MRTAQQSAAQRTGSNFAQGVPWEVLLRDYDLQGGQLLVLLWLTTSAAVLLRR